MTGADVQDQSRGLLVQLGGGMIHGPRGRQLELLKGAEKHQMGLYVVRVRVMHPGVVFGQPPMSRTQQTLEKQLRACVPCVLDVYAGGILQAEGVRRKNKAIILAQYGQIGISQDIQQCMCLIRYNLR